MLPKIKLLGIAKCDVDERWEFHNLYSYFSRLYYITSGEGTIRFQGERSYELKAEHIYLVPPHCYFDLSAAGRSHHEYNVEFKAAMPDGIEPFSYYNYLHEIPAADDDLAIFDRLHKLNPDFRMLHHSGTMVPENYFRSYHNQDYAAVFETEMLLLKLLRKVIATGSRKELPGEVVALNRVIRQLHLDKFKESMTLAEAGEIAGYSPRYFNKLFHRHTGLSFHRYILFNRLEIAGELLKSTSMSLDEIARQCGFSSAPHLSKLFQKYLHKAPGSF